MSVTVTATPVAGLGVIATATVTPSAPAAPATKKESSRLKKILVSIGVDVMDSAAQKDNQPHLVFIVDISGSMGQHAARLIKHTLPEVMKRLETQKCTLHTFESDHKVHRNMTADGLVRSGIGSRGCTYFEKCVSQVAQDLIRLEGNVRIVTISDGYMHDIDRAAAAASSFAELVRSNPRRRINSQAIRFITSRSGQPDTRGLSSVLQFNTTTDGEVGLMDWDAVSNPTNEMLGEIIAGMFLDDGLDDSLSLDATEGGLLLADPWESPVPSIMLNSKGTTTFWLAQMPEDGSVFTVHDHRGSTLEVSFTANPAPTTADGVEAVVAHAVKQYMKRIRVLQVLNTDSATKTIQTIANYFSELDARLSELTVAMDEPETVASVAPSTRDRLRRLKKTIKQERKSLVAQLCMLANDSRVASLNAMQQAEYLRQTTVSKNSKGLARRVLNDDIDVDALVHAEALAVATHIGDLDDIDDSNHLTSFWSMQTTLGSLREFASFILENKVLVEEMKVADILRCISIVGVAARGQVGDYPDPMTWRADNVYAGCFVSVADISENTLLNLRELAKAGTSATTASATTASTVVAPALTVPGSDHTKKITTAIPVFDHPAIHRFLMKYAPTILECSAGIGMRGMIAPVAMTHAYSILSGAWSITDMLLRQEGASRTHVDCTTSHKLFRDASIAFGKYFARVYPYLTAGAHTVGGSSGNDSDSAVQPGPGEGGVEGEGAVVGKKVHNILNNGLSNMLLVQLYAAKQGLSYDRASVLRAVYNYECYQFTKKILNRHADEKMAFIAQTLTDVLQLSYDRDCVDVGAAFTPTPDFAVDFALAPAQALTEKLTATFTWVEAGCLIPSVFDAFVTAHTAAFADVPQGGAVDAALVKEEETVVALFRELPTLGSPDVFRTALGIDHDVPLSTYRCIQLLQGLKFHSKQLRFDDSADVMKVPDVTSMADCQQFARSLVMDIYKEEYDARVKAKQAKEYSAAVDSLVTSLLNTSTVVAFIKMFQEGKEYKGLHAQIKNESSEGVKALVAGLADTSFNIPARLEKIGAFMLATVSGKTTSGKASEVVVWNNGNTYRGDVSVFERVFAGQIKKWYGLKKKHKKLSIHTYRSFPNRHGHSNDNPSYWALGFKDLDEMKLKVSAEEFQTYCHNHANCCGLAPV